MSNLDHLADDAAPPGGTRRFIILLVVVFSLLALTVVGLFAAMKWTSPKKSLMGTTATAPDSKQTPAQPPKNEKPPSK